MNTLGTNIRLTTFGQSHGPSMGGVLDGMPAGISIDLDQIQRALDLRRPGQSHLTSSRQESDRFEILSGLYLGKTTGAPIGFVIPNRDHRSSDYSPNINKLRPSHADYTYLMKYGHYDPIGGGRSSARETASWVLAGAIVQHLIPEVQVLSFVVQVGSCALPSDYHLTDPSTIYSHPVRCPEPNTADQMAQLIDQARAQGDTLGGVIKTIVTGVPAGWGSPVFAKLEAMLAHAMMSIPSTKGFEIGSGFEGAKATGSTNNDLFVAGGQTTTNNSGGIQGGISNGMPIEFRVAFKPVSTIFIPQDTIDQDLLPTQITMSGRHDPCVLPRAVPIVSALTILVLGDAYLANQNAKI